MWMGGSNVQRTIIASTVKAQPATFLRFHGLDISNHHFLPLKILICLDGTSIKKPDRMVLDPKFSWVKFIHLG